MRDLTVLEMELVSGGVPFVVLPLIIILIPAPAEEVASKPG